MTLERGAVLNNRYQIIEILGQGGMGALYRAVDGNLDVEVAVKENLFTTDEYARQFRQEAIILANLRHENLPRVSDHFVIDGQGQYLVMDYIEGEDLRDRMDKLGVIPEEDVLKIGAALCDALTYMHTQTPPVLHRDIKPGNVKITSSGQVYLVDFGLAKVAYSGQRTTTGARAMTPGFSPPEQYGGARTDNRSDIYSLAATLYAALANSMTEDSLARTMQQTELTPLRVHNPKVSKKMAAAIEKALEVHPDDRYQNAEEFKGALLSAAGLSKDIDIKLGAEPPRLDDQQDLKPSNLKADRDLQGSTSTGAFSLSTNLTEEDFTPGPKPRPNKKRGCFTLLVTLLVILIVGGGILSITNHTLYRQLMGSVSSLAFNNSPKLPVPWDQRSTPTMKSASTEMAVIPPDETLNTSTPTQTFTPSPTVTPMPTITATRTTQPTSTPMGGGYGQIAFASDRSGLPQIWLINVDGSGTRQLTDMQRGACQPAWSPGGAQLIFISPCERNQEIYRDTSLFIIDADGSNLTTLFTSRGGDFDPVWSPDGQYIAFTSLRTNKRPQIYVMEVATKEVERISKEYSWDINPSWSPDGSDILFITTRNGPHQIWTMTRDGDDQVRFSTSQDMKNTHPVWSADKKEILYTQSPVGGIPQLMAANYPDGATEEFRVYTAAGSTPMREANYSPDASWLIFESWPDGTQHDIYIMRSNGDEIIQLTFDLGVDFDAVWRPTAP